MNRVTKEMCEQEPYVTWIKESNTESGFIAFILQYGSIKEDVFEFICKSDFTYKVFLRMTALFHGDAEMEWYQLVENAIESKQGNTFIIDEIILAFKDEIPVQVVQSYMEQCHTAYEMSEERRNYKNKAGADKVEELEHVHGIMRKAKSILEELKQEKEDYKRDKENMEKIMEQNEQILKEQEQRLQDIQEDRNTFREHYLEVVRNYEDLQMKFQENCMDKMSLQVKLAEEKENINILLALLFNKISEKKNMKNMLDVVKKVLQNADEEVTEEEIENIQGNSPETGDTQLEAVESDMKSVETEDKSDTFPKLLSNIKSGLKNKKEQIHFTTLSEDKKKEYLVMKMIKKEFTAEAISAVSCAIKNGVSPQFLNGLIDAEVTMEELKEFIEFLISEEEQKDGQ